MREDWSDFNKSIQMKIRKKDTFEEGIAILLNLRQQMMQELLQIKKDVKEDAFHAIPFINAKGYRNKTIAYSIWHTFRIEDIVTHVLMKHDEQIFNAGGYQERINSPIVTTGNELVKQGIAEFSERLNIDALYDYAMAVMKSTDKMLLSFSYTDLKRKITDSDKTYLTSLHVVSESKDAHWLIDYWCGKDIRGLIQMPLSRHWIMHVEACIHIKDKICK